MAVVTTLAAALPNVKVLDVFALPTAHASPHPKLFASLSQFALLESLTFAPYAKEGQYQLSAQKCSGIAEIKSLKSLSLHVHCIVSLAPLASLPSLSILEVTAHDYDSYGMSQLTGLVSLSFDVNHGYLPPLFCLTNLTSLCLTGRGGSELPDGLAACSKLQRLLISRYRFNNALHFPFLNELSFDVNPSHGKFPNPLLLPMLKTMHVTEMLVGRNLPIPSFVAFLTAACNIVPFSLTLDTLEITGASKHKCQKPCSALLQAISSPLNIWSNLHCHRLELLGLSFEPTQLSQLLSHFSNPKALYLHRCNLASSTLLEAVQSLYDLEELYVSVEAISESQIFAVCSAAYARPNSSQLRFFVHIADAEERGPIGERKGPSIRSLRKAWRELPPDRGGPSNKVFLKVTLSSLFSSSEWQRR